MDWVRGEFLGSGSFGTVHLAKHKKHSVNFPSITAVKSCEISNSFSLQNEKHVLNCLASSPRIINCFGDDQTFENGKEYYNIFLEYASGGTLSDQLVKYGGQFPENVVRCCTRSILEGLKHIHENGFVHCDLKLPNILVFDKGNVKISDFGLAKEAGVEIELSQRCHCRGTPMCNSPESVSDNVYEPPMDIWALGCAVVEMISGKPAWDISDDPSPWWLLYRIGLTNDSPLIPGEDELSKDGRDFLEKCFVRDPLKRWSADMLLKHPFVRRRRRSGD